MDKYHRCNYPKGNDVYCRLKAGWGTTHLGTGRCKHHENAVEPEEPAKPTTYDQLIKEHDLADLIRILKAKSDPTDLTEDLELARAIVLDFVNRARALETALLRWDLSWDRDWQASTYQIVEKLRIAQAEQDWESYANLLQMVPDPLAYLAKPKKVLDVSEAVRMLKDVAIIVEKITNMQQAGSVPIRDVEVILIEVAGATERTIRHHVDDPTTRDRLLSALQIAYGALRLEPGQALSGGHGSDQGHGLRRGLDA
jgi:hypothetical protein